MMRSVRHDRSHRSLFRFAAPAVFYSVAGRLAPWFVGTAAILAVTGLWIAFLVAPTDYRQEEVYRIVFLHVPAAWMSMFIYLVMGFWAAAGMVMGTRLSYMMMRALAPTGALFCFIALWSGALWGKPTWGAYWVWDARLTSQLLLLFLYLGFLALTHLVEDERRADRAGAMVALIGVVNVPIIYFSVYWWNTLHQGASISPAGSVTMPYTMLAGILVMTLAAWSYSVAVTFWRLRCHILRREQHTEWVSLELDRIEKYS